VRAGIILPGGDANEQLELGRLVAGPTALRWPTEAFTTIRSTGEGVPTDCFAALGHD
jgi:hypothetical protein